MTGYKLQKHNHSFIANDVPGCAGCAEPRRSMSAEEEREQLISWAKQLADPNWCLSVPAEAKDVIRRLVAEIEND